MARNTHGGFDQVIEISNPFFEEQARSKFNLSAQNVSSKPTDPFEFTGRIQANLRRIWFGDMGETFDPVTGNWRATPQVAPFNAVVFALEIKGELRVKKISVAFNGATIPIPTPNTGELIRVHVVATFLAPVSVEQLAVRKSRDEAFPTFLTPTGIVIMPTNSFFINVMPNQKLVRDSPFVKWANGLIEFVERNFPPGPGDPETLVMNPILQALEQQVENELMNTLRNTSDWKLNQPQRLVLVDTNGMNVRRLEMVTTYSSIRGFMEITGTGGVPQQAVTSQLLARPGVQPDDALAITVNGRALAEQLREPLRNMFGLQQSDFVANEPCTVSTPAGVKFGGSTYTLRFLQAGTDELNRMILWLQLLTSQAGADITIEIELPIMFSATRAVRNGKQVLIITPRVGAAVFDVMAMTFPIYHFIVESVARQQVEAALRGPFNLPSIVIDMPQHVEIVVNEVELFQANAPRPTRTTPGLHLIGRGPMDGIIISPPSLAPARFREHDLVIRMAAFDLGDVNHGVQSSLDISCVQPDSSDPNGRIDSVGGILDDGGVWSMPIDDAIDWIEGGKPMYVTVPGQGEQRVQVVRAAPDYPISIAEKPYLRAGADASFGNNLALLPACSDGSEPGTVPPRTVTKYSSVQVHWRDFFPIGDDGNEIVSLSTPIDPSCIITDVVLEMVERDGTVRASHRFGGSDAQYGGGGARMTNDPIGGNNSAVNVRWYFDPYSVCRYRLRYTLQGLAC
jgi:hypothetical protein